MEYALQVKSTQPIESTEYMTSKMIMHDHLQRARLIIQSKGEIWKRRGWYTKEREFQPLVVDIAHDLPKSNVLRRTAYEYNIFKYMQFYARWTKNIVFLWSEFRWTF